MKTKSLPCFDAGSRYCPCILVETGYFVDCSIMRGDVICDFGWRGLCIYEEFLRNGKKSTEKRTGIPLTVTKRDKLTDQAFIIELTLPEDITTWMEHPGSFVLIRPTGQPESYNVPISVSEMENSKVKLAVEVIGPKTAILDKTCLPGAEIIVTAPFWSGIHGLPNTGDLSYSNVLIIAKGMGQAPVPKLAKYILSRNGSVTAMLGPGSLGLVFIEESLKNMGAQVELLPKEKNHNMNRIEAELRSGKYDIIVSANSLQQHLAMLNLIETIDDPPQFAWISNFSMTCAEGICGSCLACGVRTCKAKLPGKCLAKSLDNH